MEGMKNMSKIYTVVFSLILIILMFLVVGCGNQTLGFPDLNNTSPPTPPSPPTSEVNIDFYIQATPSMRGFVAGGSNIFSRTIEQLDAPLSQWLANNRKESYYRFDISGIDTKSNWPFYSISRNEFFSDALTESFYSLDWILDSAAYGWLYENLHGRSTDLKIIQEPYIENTLRGVKDEHLSIVVTDLLDLNLGTGIVNPLSEMISSDTSVIIYAIDSSFSGEHPVPGSNLLASTTRNRAFYILIIGPREYVSLYSNQLEKRLSDQGILSEPFYLLNGALDVVENNNLREIGEPQRMDLITGENLERYVSEDFDGRDVFIYYLMRGSDDGSISFDLTLNLDLDMHITSENTRLITVNDSVDESDEEPSSLQSSYDDSLDNGYFFATYSLEGLVSSSNYDYAEKNIGDYFSISDSEVESFLRLDKKETGFVFKENSDVATFTLVINKEDLRISYGRSPFRLTVDLHYIVNSLSPPNWVSRNSGSINEVRNGRTPNLASIMTDLINIADQNRETNRLVSSTRLYLIIR